MNRRVKGVLIASISIGCVLLAGGCSYYEVTDPASGRVYYTDNWALKQNSFTGTMNFSDAKSGKRVNLQSSEIREISKQEYDSGISR